MQNGLLIARIRTNLNLSQKNVANYLNVPLASYKLFESSIRPMKIRELNILSDFFKISLNTLLSLSTNTSNLNLQQIDYKYLKFSLKYVRKINRVTQKDLASEFKLSVPTIARYEKNPLNVNACYLYNFAKKFHVSIDYICGKTLKKEVL